ncbi:MAG: hypothetical protein ACR2QU_11245 [Gammaproteobacteria bacterium]
MVKGNLLGVIAAASLLAACQQNGQATDKDGGPGGPTSGSNTAAEDNVASPGKEADGMTYQEQIDAAKVDFADRFNKSVDEFEVWEAVGVDWRSGALGCPKKGMNFTMALVPGLRVVIKSGEVRYDYHARQGETPFYCPPDRVEKPASSMQNAIM